MLTAIVLVCALSAVPDPADCNRQNASQVIVLSDTYVSPVTCLMHGQAYVAETALGIDFSKEHIRIICRPRKLIALAAHHPER
jgi:hypothetical protein